MAKRYFSIDETVLNEYIIRFNESKIQDIKEYIRKNYNNDVWQAEAQDKDIYSVYFEQTLEHIESDNNSIQWYF